jgi:hypothetical protein
VTIKAAPTEQNVHTLKKKAISFLVLYGGSSKRFSIFKKKILPEFPDKDELDTLINKIYLPSLRKTWGAGIAQSV